MTRVALLLFALGLNFQLAAGQNHNPHTHIVLLGSEHEATALPVVQLPLTTLAVIAGKYTLHDI